MLAKLYAINIMKGNITFERVPRLLKAKVKKELEIADMEQLTVEDIIDRAVGHNENEG